MFRLVVLSLIIWGMSMLPAQAAKRALIIGNNAYDELPDLQKAVADARAYSDVFSRLGYEVTKNEDLSTLQMQRTIGNFIDTIEPGDEVAFVYAGHGWSDGSTNYIIGADTEKLTTSATLRRAAIPIENGTNGVVDDLRAQGARIVLAVLDACRTNPFQSKNGRSGSVGLSRGLVLLTPVSGTFTVFSAGAGEEALDRLDDSDNHPNSVFSRVFLSELGTGGNLQDIVLDTAPKVAALASGVGHSQRPSYYDGIGERYCLSQNCAALPPLLTQKDKVPVPSVQPKTIKLDEPLVAAIAPDTFKTDPPLPKSKLLIEAAPLAAISDLERQAPVQNLEAQSAATPPVEQTLLAAPLVAEEDPYFRPDQNPPSIPQPAKVPTPTPTGAPVQFIVRSASTIRSLPQLDRESICSVEKTPQQPTITNFFTTRQMSHHNRRFRNLKQAIVALERSRCSAIAVPPRLVSDVISAVRDPSRYVVLPEIVR